ncbi:MAG: DoxX family protein [Saprospiraceae bacterium]
MTMNEYFENKKGYGLIFLRLVIGLRLVLGVWDSIVDWQQMLGVREFFEQAHIPFPMFSAFTAVYAEFIGGVLVILGLWIRPASILLIITFLIAIIFIDMHNPFVQSFSAWVILASSFTFLFCGAGRISMDEWLRKRAKSRS